MLDVILAWWPWLLAGFITGRVLVWIRPLDALPGLPLLGNVVALSRHGTAYISHARRKFGDVFTLNLVGKGMTFLHDPALINAFFSAPDSQISFRPAVEQFTQRAFGMPSKEFFPKHSDILKDMRHMLVPAELGAHAAKLSQAAVPLISKLFPDGQEVELFEAVTTLVFQAAVETLFGPTLFKCVPGGAQQLQRTFLRFDHNFELGASPVPHLLQPTFVKSRAQLLVWLRDLQHSPGFSDTTMGQLVGRSGLPSELHPNMLLMLLWASQANTIPATFWSTAMLLLPENGSYAEAILSELNQELRSSAGPRTPTDAQLADAAAKLAMDRKSMVSRCVAEAIRLRCHSIDLRIVSGDCVELTSSSGSKVALPKGRILAICPWESHHDSGMYPDAWRFNPDRAPLALGDGSAVVHSVAGLVFGGGTYRCPGRFFAEMEVALLVQLLLWHRQLKLVPRSSPDITTAGAPVEQDANSQASAPAPGQPVGLVAAFFQVYGPFALQVLGERAEWGLGLFEGTPGAPAGEAGPSSGQLETWKTSGDEQGLLPACDLHRLVGLKVPKQPCLVTCSTKQNTGK